MTLKMMSSETLRLRALFNARGLSGCLAQIGTETRTQRELVEEGHLFQETFEGIFYNFTLSPSGQPILDHAEENGWRIR